MSDQLNTLVAQLKERRANTFQDRIKSLDLRDEIWRKYIEQNKNLVDPILAQRTGLCTDMCSERERMTREFQRLYKSYELDSINRALSHPLMVTAYSRASADQAMLSPYDLRSDRTLLRTMNYLITNVMDKFDHEQNKTDWYNFLWDRLRAIRKELTQQHLRNEIAIEILEQCTRFHIFCAAFLSEYSADAFDPKLNDKVLIDCLNQLRDCYKVQKCANKVDALKNLGELCSYMLLINLSHDNETLLLTRQLIQNITDQPEVKFAIEIQRALTMNNTAKFFSLIEKDATLLQSCLMNRYFSIVRLKRSTSLVPQFRRSDDFRLLDLVDILGIDDEDQARDYLQQLGYAVTNSSTGQVTLTHTDDMTNEPIKLPLSQKLIQRKYQGKLRDIITGKRDAAIILPDDNVETSFDSQGGFIGKLPGDLDKILSSNIRPPAVVPITISHRIRAPNPTEPTRPIQRIVDPVARPNPSLFVASSSLPRLENRIPSVPNDPSNILFGQRPTLGMPTSFEQQRPLLSGNQSSSVHVPFRQGTVNFPRAENPVLLSDGPRYDTPARIQAPAREIPPKNIELPAPVLQRMPLSSTKVEEIITEIYDGITSSIIQETTMDIYDEMIRRWNQLTGQTVKIYHEFVDEEILSIVKSNVEEIEFRQKLLNDTKREHYERQRKKYLSRKYFSIWLRKVCEAVEERWTLNQLQEKYKFSNNEQLLEFLLGLELMSEQKLDVGDACLLLKSRRILKRRKEKEIDSLADSFFNELLQEEFQGLVVESNGELDFRNEIFQKSLEKQFQRQRQRFLAIKYFSLWFSNSKQRKQVRQRDLINYRKRSIRTEASYVNKKRKDHHQKYDLIRKSFDQIHSDLQQIQLSVNKLTS